MKGIKLYTVPIKTENSFLSRKASALFRQVIHRAIAGVDWVTETPWPFTPSTDETEAALNVEVLGQHCCWKWSSLLECAELGLKDTL